MQLHCNHRTAKQHKRGPEMATTQPESPLKSPGERTDEDAEFFKKDSPSAQFNGSNFWGAPMMNVDGMAALSPKVKGLKKAACASADGFSAAVKAAQSTSNHVFVLLTGAKGAAGVSWCPDCTAAEPYIEAKLAELDSAGSQTFLECAVDKADRAAWKAAVPGGMTAVPQLMLWGATKPIRTLIEGQILDSDLLDDFFDT
eukprot:SAG22_NODE_4873_length_1145_cov_1.021989_2_plen_200_part_00